MIDPATERHNRAAHDFVMGVASEARTHPELMVVIESAILATMLLSRRFYGLPAAASAAMVEAAVQRATERFTQTERSK